MADIFIRYTELHPVTPIQAGGSEAVFQYGFSKGRKVGELVVVKLLFLLGSENNVGDNYLLFVSIYIL